MIKQEEKFVKLLDVLGNFKEKTIVEFINRCGIENKDIHTGLTSHHRCDETGAFEDPELNCFSNSVELLQALTIVCNWSDDGLFWNVEDVYKGFDELFNFGWTIDRDELVKLEEELFPRLVNLYTILDSPNGPHPALVFQEILFGGCYKSSTSTSYYKFNSTSKQVPKALAAIGMYAKYADHHDYWEWLEEDNPLYDYGWPKDELPKFRWSDEYPDTRIIHELETLTSIYKDGLHTVAKILWLEQANPVAVNKAILKNGIWKITPLGSSVYMGPENFVEDDKIEKNLSTDLLQKSLVAFAKPLLAGEKLSVEMLDVNNGALSNYGWPSEHLPTFEIFFKDIHPDPPSAQQNEKPEEVLVDAHDAFSKDSKSNEPFMPTQVAPTDDLSQQSKKGYDLLVLGLLAFINGEFTPQRNTDPYTKQDDLAQLLKDRIDAHGMSIGTIKTKFGAANALRDTVNLKPLKEVSKTAHLKSIHKQLESNPKPLYGISDETHQESPDPKSISGGTF